MNVPTNNVQIIRQGNKPMFAIIPLMMNTWHS